MSSFASQILHDYANVSLLQLNYISLASVSLAFTLALVIPAPHYIVGLNESSTVQPSSSGDQDHLILDDDIGVFLRIKEKLNRGKINVMLSYKSVQTRRWAYWAIVTSALYFMVSSLLKVQILLRSMPFCAEGTKMHRQG